MKRIILDFLTLTAFFAAICAGAAAARAGDSCEKWVETRDGVDVQTGDPVTCDGAHGPLSQFSEMLKCVTAGLPACEIKRQAESDKAAKTEAALRKGVQIEKRRGDKHKAENVKLRERLRELATVEVYEHPAFWAGVGAVAVAVVWILVETAR
jgi:hypothetical protein